MDKFNELALGEKIILIAGSVLLLDSFLPWYSVDFGFASVSRNGWQSPGALFSLLAVLLGVAMAAQIGVSRFTTTTLPDNLGGMAWPQVHMIAGIASLALVVIKFLNENEFTSFGFYLGFLAAGALCFGGVMLNNAAKSGGSAASSPPAAPPASPPPPAPPGTDG
jgi:hypothetical protein